MKSEKCYYSASYSRLSKDDGDKAESDSIKNQKELIRNYQESHPEITIVEEYSDDGYSGINFERPDFKRMMEDVKAKKINCIIVKDLSRFGRNYIETGKYMEQILPFLGIRFIAINDNYDSISKKQQGDQIILPFKNLVNDTYCRDISIKVRSNLNAKRRKGDYVGAFSPYGYLKSEENRNRLVVDPPAAKVVKRIFQLKIEGKSNAGIADILNNECISTPYEHKKHTIQGKNYKPSFYVKSSSLWSVAMIIRILENEVYLGHLVQGKTVRPNYKIREQFPVDKKDWIRALNTHEAIITENDFKLVQKLLMLDTRTAPGNDQIYLFSGILCCGKCGKTLIRRVVSIRGEKYTYYGCYTRDRKINCKGVSIRESAVAMAVLASIQKHVELMIEMDKLLQYVDELPLRQKEIVTIEGQIKSANEEILKYKKLKVSLHRDYHEGLVERDEYMDLKNIYDASEKKLEQSTLDLAVKKRAILEGKSNRQQSIALFKQYRNIQNLDRKTLVTLVSRIDVLSSKEIDICFTYQDEFDEMCLHVKKLEG